MGAAAASAIGQSSGHGVLPMDKDTRAAWGLSIPSSPSRLRTSFDSFEAQDEFRLPICD
ncbi:MAG: hypothetical protein V1790_01400 [Planctomycetota bacterium]